MTVLGFAMCLWKQRSVSTRAVTRGSTTTCPGGTTDIYWESAAPGAYDVALDKVANDEIRALRTGLCKPN
jgi:hypothetical protein